MKLDVRFFSMLVACLLLLWVAFMSHFGLFVVWQDYWSSALVMVFGSFVAGSTPLGGGAVAFPVFSKFFAIEAEQAKVFSLFIQSVGMTSATLFFIFSRIYINWKVLLALLPTTIVGFIWVMSGPLLVNTEIKLLFSICALVTGMLLLLSHKKGDSDEKQVTILGLALMGVAGGALAATLGAGADTMLFFCLAILYRRPAKQIIPTTVTYMALTSIIGSTYILTFEPEIISPFVSNSWLVAAPVVLVFAPIGGWVMSKANPKALLLFIKIVLFAEASSTLFFSELSFTQAMLLLAILVVSFSYFLKNFNLVFREKNA